MFRKERKILSFTAMIQICLLVVVCMAGLTGWVEWQSTKFAADLVEHKKQFQIKTTQLISMGKVSPSKNLDALKQELSDLERKLSEQRKTITELTQVRDNFGSGVSEYLSSFSRQSPKGVWLTGFNVKQGGSILKIEGSSLKPSLIPIFLQNLSTEPVLEGARFGMLEIEREATNGQYVDFIVYTGVEIPNEDEL